ncbi:hypothetical protein CAPTEDRAFT_148077 [Capitella teleta]|uniref:UNC-50-like protein n=1 Tax=Capitella teleta TaxID=283909 RepID=R7UNM3_CAPTE|nr:hypothetical protein CAPTEDRAFT_148077 [Capitella teleta]|eukprot:ELU08114.1 hypothetical protein CAPTEDRAFT_148077 [Capitella teleta]
MYDYGKYSPPTSPLPSATITQTQMQSPARQDSQDRHSATAKRHKYLRRLFKFRQMDFEYAFWQMLYLIVAPQKVYRNFAYRKQTKDQWARDDPAFLVLLSFWLCASSVGFALVLGLHFVAFIKFLLWVILVDCVGVGLLVASIFWLLTNRYLILQPPRGQDVEWGYCFDVHLNAFFPLLMILHVFQLPLLRPFITHDLFISRFFGNSLWLIAVVYYIYITFLGYSSLPFLKNTRLLLYPMSAMLLIYFLSLGLGWNFSQGLCYFYKYRVW